MNTLTIIWIALPFFVGFVGYLVPKVDRYLALAMTLVSASYAARVLMESMPLTVELMDNFGVTLQIDSLSGYFILTNALVTAAVICYCWGTGKSAFFYTQTIILHGSVNAVFICADFISLYVALEVIGIAAFLLVSYPRTNRAIWVALRYLFISNTAMLFYLVGAVLVYQANNSFAFAGLAKAPPEALALIFLGLLTKGGIFVSGLWLPLTHSESETPVSALLSGVVVKTGVFPLARMALMVDAVAPVITLFGIGTAFLGISLALFEQDTKRLLAQSTISQLGFILAAPAVGGFYALTHGLVKATLFLTAGTLPSRDFQELHKQPIPRSLWLVLVMASCSISGIPLWAGFASKALTLKSLLPWQMITLNIATVGTSAIFAKFIFLPHQSESKSIRPGFWVAVLLLLGGLLAANGVYYQAYTLANIGKAIAKVGIGWLVYWLVIRRVVLKLPRVQEQIEHLIGGMSLMLVLLFWMVLA
ncbi:cation:proton antiporter [Acaryochloris sp. CCMEE 5410]|uniref:cation:proton antiporter n=1 Tax=Acaryochloris sp. CCMEE 5410 TaxID=310037 RepID=UPI0002484C0A|nr:cation:proton antiporter [Acaryochloris sp. CCMEE 5410]KAI9134921.1 cation:proton antiporter [Acaryochloris sp. CCMEE 5410]